MPYMLEHGSTDFVHIGTDIALPATLTIDDWVEEGRQIATEYRNYEWRIGDWCKTGQDLFGDQIKEVLPTLGLQISQVHRAAKIARQFPESERIPELSFKHYEYLKDLPHGEARKILSSAIGKPRNQIRLEAEEAKERVGVAALLNDDTPQRRQFVAIMLAYNRADPEVREDIFDCISAMNGNYEDVIVA
jgi:hypothetical protein